MTDVEAAWVAGILEGEGYFNNSTRKNRVGKSYGNYSVSCQMTDLDVLERLESICGGTIYGPRAGRRESHKQIWTWVLCKKDRVKDLLTRILPYLLVRRSTAVRKLIKAIDNSPGPLKGVCPSGMGEKRCGCGLCKARIAERMRRLRSSKKLRSETCRDSSARKCS